jgi:7-carboxy-7-deazaguanine synthase
MLRVHSIFKSINGEVTRNGQGSLCTFIRLQGCNLSCSYCDTKDSRSLNTLNEPASVHDIFMTVELLGSQNITITGGEPLYQKKDLERLSLFLDQHKYHVSIETNGSFLIPKWSHVHCWIADWKSPSSGSRKHMFYSNFKNLRSWDFVKFVIGDRADFEDAMDFVIYWEYQRRQKKGQPHPHYAFSPIHGTSFDSALLVDWMSKIPLLLQNNAILNLQLHKIIGVK